MITKDNKTNGVILYSTADWNNPFWTNKQHTAIHLANLGYKVLYIESLGLRRPTIKSQDIGRILRRILSFFRGAKKVHKNIYVYSPLVIPLHRFLLVRTINKVLLELIIRYYKITLNLENHIAWTYNPTITDLIKSQKPKYIVYHNVDKLSASPGIDQENIIKNEKILLKESDIVFCTSKTLFQSSKEIAGDKVHYFPNVVDFDHFYKSREKYPKPDDLKPIFGPIIGFVGAISNYKFDFTLISNLAEKRPEWNFLLIGKIGEGQPDTSLFDITHKNIYLIGPKDYDTLPSYLSFFNAAIIPCPINEYTQNMFPMKYFEYLAAGIPTIARDILPLADLKSYHYSYNSLEEFEKSIQDALTFGERAPQESCKLAMENTWENRLKKMLYLINRTLKD